MKNTYKKVLGIIMALCIFAAPGFATAENGHIQVDETVYALLSAEGAVEEMETVVKIGSPDGKFAYYGDFEEIEALTPGTGYEYLDGVLRPEKQISGEAVYFSLKSKGRLPVVLEIRHFMDGKETPPADCAGRKGLYRMEMDIKPNPEADPGIAEQFVAQIQLRVDTSTADEIKSPEAVRVVAGRYLQLAWTVMPGSDKTFFVEYETENLKTEDLSVTLTGSEGMLPSEFEEISKGLEQLDGGMVMVFDAYGQLETGMVEGVSGLGGLESGAETIASGFEEFTNSFGRYGEGLQEYVGSVSSVGAAISKSAEGLGLTSDGLDKLEGSYSMLEAGYSQTAKAIEELVSAAGAMAESGDEKAIALYKGLEAVLKGLEELNVGFSESNNAMKEASAGVHEVSEGLTGLKTGLEQLDGAGEGVLSGFEGMKKGINDISYAFDGLLQGISSSKDGFTEMLSGLEKANESYSSLSGAVSEMNNRIMGLLKEESEEISFTDPRNDIDSLQFFISAKGIEMQKNNNIEEETEQIGFLARLWDKIKSLF